MAGKSSNKGNKPALFIVNFQGIQVFLNNNSNFRVVKEF